MLLSARAIWHFFLIMAFEVSIINALRGLADTAPAVNAVMRFTAAYLPYAAVPALFIFVVRRLGLGKRQTLFVLLFAALSVALAETGLVVLHELLPRARPFAALQFEPLVAVSRALASFPSGHASVLFALAFSAFAFDKLTGWLLVAVAALIVLPIRFFVAQRFCPNIRGRSLADGHYGRCAPRRGGLWRGLSPVAGCAESAYTREAYIRSDL